MKRNYRFFVILIVLFFFLLLVAPLHQWRDFLGLRKQVVRPPVGTTFVVETSAYASSPLQTDSTPCVTAAGTRVRPGVVATNFLPFGTIVAIDGVPHIVEDRMNPRFNGLFLDVWLPSTTEALEFGRKKIEIVIQGYGTPGQTVSEEEEPSIWQRVSLRFIAISRLIASSLRARVSLDVDRYDVACYETTIPEKE
ncbi:MAG: hypothetical protein WEA04_04695 [Candidatus Andersenbacteria bacterium]